MIIKLSLFQYIKNWHYEKLCRHTLAKPDPPIAVITFSD